MPDLQKVQSELENKFKENTAAVDEAALKLWHSNPELAKDFLTDYSASMAGLTLEKWSKLYEFLLVKYLDGNVKQEENGSFKRNQWGYPASPEFPGYEDSYKKMVIDETGKKFEMPNNKKE